jgi:UPF0755 protein
VVSGQPLPLAASPADFRIAPGSSLRSAIGQMRERVSTSPVVPLVLLARAGRSDTGIKAGSVLGRPRRDAAQLLDKLVRGQVTQGDATLVEAGPSASGGPAWTPTGSRARQPRHERGADHRTFGLPVGSLEGWQFPIPTCSTSAPAIST